MYTDTEFERLEEEEHSLTMEEVALMLLLLGTLQSSLEKELRQFYQKYGKDGVVAYRDVRKWVSKKDRRKRLAVLLLFINEKFTSLLDELKSHFTMFLTGVTNKEREFFNVTLDDENLLLTKWGTDNLNWLDRLTDDVELWPQYIALDIKRSILRQDDIESVLKLVNKRFTSIEQILQRLAITESTAMNSIARRRIFKELGVTKYRFYTRADERTCEICGSMHGLVFPISSYEIGVNASPMHPRCRCWEVPIVD